MMGLGLNLIVYTTLFFVLAFEYPAERDVYVGLAISIITIFITVYLVDIVVKANERSQWDNVEKVARDEIITLSIDLVSNVTVPISFPFMTEWLKKVEEFLKSETYLKDITDWDMQKVSEMGVANLLGQLTDDGWRGLYKSIQKAEMNTRDCIMLYSRILPPKILGGLLDLNKDFKDDYSIFGNSFRMFVQQIGTSGLKPEAKEAYIKHYTKDLEAYFDKVKMFREQLSSMSWQ